MATRLVGVERCRAAERGPAAASSDVSPHAAITISELARNERHLAELIVPPLRAARISCGAEPFVGAKTQSLPKAETALRRLTLPLRASPRWIDGKISPRRRTNQHLSRQAPDKRGSDRCRRGSVLLSEWGQNIPSRPPRVASRHAPAPHSILTNKVVSAG
jgi:hypothetical protein